MVRGRRRPANLHIAHSWGGGLSKWVADFAHFDPYSDNFVVRSHGTVSAYGLEFSLALGGHGAIEESWVPANPVAVTAIEHPEYRHWLESVIERYSIDHVYVSSLIGHSLDLLDLPVPMTIVHHDYFPYCIALLPWFGEECRACDGTRLSACHRANPRSELMRRNGPPYWMRVRREYLSHLRRKRFTHVVPSVATAEHLRSLDQTFADLDFEVIPHGLHGAVRSCFGSAEPGRRLRFLLLGRLKDPERLDRLFSRLQLLGDLFLVGASHDAISVEGRHGVSVVQWYEAGDLTTILEGIQPDLAIFLNRAPETFSYALSEAWAHGLPVCTTGAGALGERVAEGAGGWRCDTDDELVELLLRLDADRDAIRQVQRRIPRHRTVQAMIDDYYRLRPDYLPLVAARLGAS